MRMKKPHIPVDFHFGGAAVLELIGLTFEFLPTQLVGQNEDPLLCVPAFQQVCLCQISLPYMPGEYSGISGCQVKKPPPGIGDYDPS